ncbi:MAG: transcriptional regulator NrdR [Planctomycetes bacterium TMED75]|nr:transcriptional regulator NrdR [Planctomycetaceae bacterium]OUU92473.1 MAG: transcriptional regulator NrdR [Planctomycetes bacterium TMED75]
MQCPYCGAYGSKVIDSRSSEGGSSIRRRRECLKCSGRFTSYERVEKTGRLMVIKKDGSRVTFDNEKILRGIQAACGKRPVSEEQKLQIVREVEETVHRAHEREVDSIEIGHHVARLLRNTDQIAFVRYASEYQSFDSLEDVEQTIQELRDMPPSVEGQSELFPSE